jgi:hypothetical protein
MKRLPKEIAQNITVEKVFTDWGYGWKFRSDALERGKFTFYNYSRRDAERKFRALLREQLHQKTR